MTPTTDSTKSNYTVAGLDDPPNSDPLEGTLNAEVPTGSTKSNPTVATVEVPTDDTSEKTNSDPLEDTPNAEVPTGSTTSNPPVATVEVQNDDTSKKTDLEPLEGTPNAEVTTCSTTHNPTTQARTSHTPIPFSDMSETCTPYSELPSMDSTEQPSTDSSEACTPQTLLNSTCLNGLSSIKKGTPSTSTKPSEGTAGDDTMGFKNKSSYPTPKTEDSSPPDSSGPVHAVFPSVYDDTAFEREKNKVLEGLVCLKGKKPTSSVVIWLEQCYQLVAALASMHTKMTETALSCLESTPENFNKAGKITPKAAMVAKYLCLIHPDWENTLPKVEESLKSWMTPIAFAQCCYMFEVVADFLDTAREDYHQMIVSNFYHNVQKMAGKDGTMMTKAVVFWRLLEKWPKMMSGRKRFGDSTDPRHSKRIKHKSISPSGSLNAPLLPTPKLPTPKLTPGTTTTYFMDSKMSPVALFETVSPKRPPNKLAIKTWCAENKMFFDNAQVRLQSCLKLQDEIMELVKKKLRVKVKPKKDKNVSALKAIKYNCNLSKFKDLKPKKWLNDIVLLCCIRMLMREKKDSWSFRSHLFTKGVDQDTNELIYDEIKDHGKNAPGGDIFNLHHVFFPINIKNVHWTLGYVDMKKHLIYYYDPMCHGCDQSGMGRLYTNLIWKYLEEEHFSLRKERLPSDWNMVDPMHIKGPQQTDTWNCGPFVTLIVEAICTLGVPPEVLFLFGDWSISSKDMDAYRYRMGAIIMKKEIPALPNLPLPIEKTVSSCPYQRVGY